MEQLEALLKRIKQAKPSLTEDQLVAELGYNSGYVSQLRSRGKVPQKFLDTLTRYADSLLYANKEPQQQSGNPDVLTIIDKLATSMQKLADSRLIDSRTMEELVLMLKQERMPIDPLMQTDAEAEHLGHKKAPKGFSSFCRIEVGF